ncbi:GNAT family N-acetyltransferase [Streptomyces sp. NBC_01017]|uniref:GNAT family N-acetyltransferase n=1 Tax=Streptomyces sp. NBC_01017 TaxID=2903721 RepID=UPI00386387BA|nr:GNAT family N-acetyltransferase [Streptomyces sp. NBC_01017]WSV34828.1 GNAT family N-acetyltransferase [Streptomyces sp. NBC_01017]
MCAGVDPSGAVVGAVALSQRAFDGSGLIHWLHAQDDDPGVISALLSHACQTLGPRRLYAFSEPAICALALVPGLPVGHHHRLADLLMGARFVPYARQRYLLLDDLLLPGRPARLPDEPPTDVTRVRSPHGWRLRIRHGAGTAASAVVLACPDDTALLWQLSVSPGHRRRGMGSRLLRECVDLAITRDARRVAVYIDHDNAAMDSFLQAHGFCHVDTLVAYERRP